MFLVVRRGLPERPAVVVTDRRVAVITLLWRIGHLPYPIGDVTRWRLHAALYEPPHPEAAPH
jgi:hypothetical protein